MIQPQTLLKIIDNTGGQIGQCLKVFNKKKNRIGTIGDIVLVSIKKAKSKVKNKKVKKKELHKAIIVHTVKKINRYDGSSVKFHKNSIILLKNDIKQKYQVLGTRVSNLVSNELRYNKENNLKILSLINKTI